MRMIGNIKSYGWTAMLVTDGSEWCRFKPDYGLAISSDGLECDTLDPNVKRVIIELEVNQSGAKRYAQLIMRQKETNTTITKNIEQSIGSSYFNIPIILGNE